MLSFPLFSTCWVVAVSLTSLFFSTAFAQSTYIKNAVDGTSSNLTFTLSIPANSSDLVFTLIGPASKSYVAIGTGSQMQGSMMFIAYANGNGQNVTLSPRISPSHNEPQFSNSIDVSLLAGSGITNGIMVVNAHCRNCKTWNGGSLDFSSTSQSWIYAVGPSQSLRSDSNSATIAQHDVYGSFSIDMVHATAQSTDIVAPSANTTSSGSKAGTSTTSTSILVVHAVLAVLGFLILMPFGAFILRFMESVRWHWVTQLVASVIAIVGGAIGFAVTNAYYDSKRQASGHKGIGIVVLIATIVQFLIGWWHHMVFKRKGHGTFFGVIHRYFGWVVMVAGTANAGIGLDLVTSTTGVVVYIVIAYVFLIAVFTAVMLIKWRKARTKGFPEIRHAAEGGGFESAGASSIPLEHYQQPARAYEQ